VAYLPTYLSIYLLFFTPRWPLFNGTSNQLDFKICVFLKKFLITKVTHDHKKNLKKYQIISLGLDLFPKFHSNLSWYIIGIESESHTSTLRPGITTVNGRSFF
jgi:hypothetical protein